MQPVVSLFFFSNNLLLLPPSSSSLQEAKATRMILDDGVFSDSDTTWRPGIIAFST